MNRKEKVGIILTVSMLSTMYPLITTYLETENTLRETSSFYSSSVHRELQKIMDNVRLQIIGFSLLFLSVGLILYYVDLGKEELVQRRLPIEKRPEIQVKRKPIKVGKVFFWISVIGFLTAIIYCLWLLLPYFTS